MSRKQLTLGTCPVCLKECLKPGNAKHMFSCMLIRHPLCIECATHQSITSCPICRAQRITTTTKDAFVHIFCLKCAHESRTSSSSSLIHNNHNNNSNNNNCNGCIMYKCLLCNRKIMDSLGFLMHFNVRHPTMKWDL